MTALGTTPAAPAAKAPRSSGRVALEGGTVLAQGEPAVWLMAGALSLAILMIASLLAVVVWNGGTTFWPGPIFEVGTVDGRRHLGEEFRRESFRPDPQLLAGRSEEVRDRAAAILAADGTAERRLLRTANFDLTGTHFHWVSEFEADAAAERRPEWAVTIERLSWGRFYGFPVSASEDGRAVAEGPEAAWRWFEENHAAIRRLWRERRALEIHEIGRVNRGIEQARLALRREEIRLGVSAEWANAYSQLDRVRRGGTSEEVSAAEAQLAAVERAGFAPPPAFREAVARYEAAERAGRGEFSQITGRIAELNRRMARLQMTFETIDGQLKTFSLAEIVRAIPQNRLSLWGRLRVYLDRWGEFLWDDPREANSEGGVFPAIFGTVAMTLIMTVLVVPFGVLAALYLREYAKAGPMISAVRIAVNNLAGVPSIVFGVFGLGFFCYIVGAGIDELLFSARLPSPTYGKGGLLWASLTLALLTLPVVIVATEEALAAVPRSMREGSYACGASKWQTIARIVLPRALPGIMTGAILAMARGAGEVAPLMLVGAVKLAPELPVDGVFPYVHPERSFMHLGFHIFDLGFQSQNSEAAKPMVYTTTLLLIGLIAILNLLAIALRARLRRRFAGSQF